MSRSRRPTPSQQQQYVDRSAPQVAEFLRVCGVLEHPVSIRFSADTRDDLQLILDRMADRFGGAFRPTQPRPGPDNDWVAYGTIIK